MNTSTTDPADTSTAIEFETFEKETGGEEQQDDLHFESMEDSLTTDVDLNLLEDDDEKMCVLLPELWEPQNDLSTRLFWKKAFYGIPDAGPLPIPSFQSVCISCLGSFIFMGILSLFDYFFLRDSEHDYLLILASFGATAIIEFGAPMAPLSQPRNSIFGQIIGGVVGIICSLYISQPMNTPGFALPLSVGMTLALMLYSVTTHPPGGGTVAFAVLAPPSASSLGWGLLLPTIYEIAVALIVTVVVMNLDLSVTFPLFWFFKTKNPPKRRPSNSSSEIIEANNSSRFFWRKWGGVPGKGPPSPPSLEYILIASIAAFSYIGILSLAQFLTDLTPDYFLIFASFGASAVLIYGAPDAPLAQPRNLMLGQLIGWLVGIICRLYIAIPMGTSVFALPFGIAVALFIQLYTSSTHPPAGGTLAVLAIGSPAVDDLGWATFVPVFFSTIMLLVVAIAANNLHPSVVYPTYWFVEQSEWKSFQKMFLPSRNIKNN